VLLLLLLDGSRPPGKGAANKPRPDVIVDFRPATTDAQDDATRDRTSARNRRGDTACCSFRCMVLLLHLLLLPPPSSPIIIRDEGGCLKFYV